MNHLKKDPLLNPKLRLWLKGVVLFAALAGVLYLLRLAAPQTEELSAFVDRTVWARGPWGMAVYALLTAGLSCLAVPRQILSFAGGFALGAVWGAVFATVGTTLGCALAFLFSRTLGRKRVERRFGPKLARWNRALARSPFLTGLVLRLLPTGNNLVFSLLAGVSRIAALPFITGSCLGYLPQNIVFSLLGSGISVDPHMRFALSAVLFVFAALLTTLLYKRCRSLLTEEGD